MSENFVQFSIKHVTLQDSRFGKWFDLKCKVYRLTRHTNSWLYTHMSTLDKKQHLQAEQNKDMHLMTIDDQETYTIFHSTLKFYIINAAIIILFLRIFNIFL